MFLSLETLTPIIRTGLPILVELINLVNSVIIFLSQMTLLRWLTFLLRSQTVILTVLLFWTFSFFWSSYLFYNGFSSIGKFWPCCCLSFHWLSIKFTIGCPHFIALLMTILVLIGTIFVIMWDVPWKDIFKLSASAATTEFCEWVQVGIDLYIPHRKYQVKLHLSPWFSAACDATIVHRNHFFHLYPKDKSSDSKGKQLLQKGSWSCQTCICY